MLPATGRFKHINCPFFDSCMCERPYCHYKHTNNYNKKQNYDTELLSEIVSKAVRKILQNKTETNIEKPRENITYNPTPISELNKYKINQLSEETPRNIIVQYSPEKPVKQFQKYSPPIIIKDSEESESKSSKRKHEDKSLDSKKLKSDKSLLSELFDTKIESRSAHSKSINREKTAINKPLIRNPAVVMANRYQKSNISSINKTDTTLFSCEYPKIKRIAHVPNVSALLEEKKKIIESLQNIKKSSATSEIILSDIPIVMNADKSKFPVNIRSKYLILIIKECMKLYQNKKTIYDRALNEEFNSYSKCSAIISYKNSIMLSINRIRNEICETPTLVTQKSDKKSKENLYNYLIKWLLTEDELLENGFPRLKTNSVYFQATKKLQKIPENSRQCARCKKIFKINETGFPCFKEDCIYHSSHRVTIQNELKFSCCQQCSTSDGCCVCDTHVYELENTELTDFVSTLTSDDEFDLRNTKIYALDCEMVYTNNGFELARVTIINTNLKITFDALVKPTGQIIDYNTKYSGLTKEILKNINITLKDIQIKLLELFTDKTILIGHSLESDLKALRLIHNNIIDTSVLFPHKLGFPKKRALRSLASEYLKKIIQNEEFGHDSSEDALTCMELVFWKLKNENKF